MVVIVRILRVSLTVEFRVAVRLVVTAHRHEVQVRRMIVRAGIVVVFVPVLMRMGMGVTVRV